MHASEERFRALAETANDAIITSDERGRIVYLNGSAQRLFGYTAGEAVGQPLTLLMPERFHEAHERGLRRFLSTGEARVVGRTVELAGRRRDGSEFPVELSLAASRAADGVSFTAIIRDITERKQAEALLERHRQELQDFVDTMSNLNAKVATDGAILLANRTARQAFGLEMEELPRANFLEGEWWAFDPEVQARVRDAFQRACAGERVNYDERLFVHGSVVDINLGLVPVKGPDGKVLYVVAEGHDVTLLKRSEKAVAERTAQLEAANQGLESFSYSVSHDLRAPLRAIDGFSRMLLEDHGHELGEEPRRLLGIIRANTARMGQLIDDLLTFSRLSRKQVQALPIDMGRLVAGVVEDLRADERSRIVVGALLPCLGDGALLRQVWTNLIGNALKFSRGRPWPRVEVGSRRAGGETVYLVRDNGVGFDMAYAGHLFGVFQRLHRPEEFEGTGVGLAIVKRIVDRHGGRVWAEAQPGEGATFYFALPCEEEDR
jgi:PAS domain S-box-containing protein